METRSTCETPCGTQQRSSARGWVAWGRPEAVYPDVSRDGGVVAFASRSPKLVPNDTNGKVDVFVWARDTGKITRVSVDSHGEQVRAGSAGASVHANGRYVAYQSLANLDHGEVVRGDNDVFVHDRISGLTTRVSVAKSGEEANGISGLPSLSADGKYVLFLSRANNLVADDFNSTWDVFRVNRFNGVIRRASVNSQGDEGDNESGTVGGDGLSARGRYAAFGSTAFNLLTPDCHTHGPMHTSTTSAQGSPPL